MQDLSRRGFLSQDKYQKLSYVHTGFWHTQVHTYMHTHTHTHTHTAMYTQTHTLTDYDSSIEEGLLSQHTITNAHMYLQVSYDHTSVVNFKL